MTTCPGPSNRREFLRAGALGFGGLCLSDVLAGREITGSRDTSVILMYLHGGPSHLETYDLKPDAPSDYRSIYSPISTTVPGMDICELFPLQARLAERVDDSDLSRVVSSGFWSVRMVSGASFF